MRGRNDVALTSLRYLCDLCVSAVVVEKYMFHRRDAEVAEVAQRLLKRVAFKGSQNKLC